MDGRQDVLHAILDFGREAKGAHLGFADPPFSRLNHRHSRRRGNSVNHRRRGQRLERVWRKGYGAYEKGPAAA